MFETVITITIATTLSLLFIRLVLQMCLDSSCDRYQSLPHWLLRFTNSNVAAKSRLPAHSRRTSKAQAPSLKTLELYSTPQDVARAALRLLAASDFHPLDHELAAAILAVQVCDWHAIKHLKHPDATREFKDQFAIQYPVWKMLLQVANGTKHPTVQHPRY